MTSSIGGSGNIQPLPQGGQGQDVPALAQQMQTQVEQLANSLSSLSADHSQANNTEFLQNVANVVNGLKQTVEKALNLRKS